MYSGLADAMSRDDVNTADLGRRIVLPSSFIGSDRAMQQLYQDSMAIVRHFGKPTFFITFTANPQWLEIKNALFPGQQASDRPDLIARVFHLKVRSLLTDLKAGVLGKYVGHVYTIEYQKRGLPHMHLLLFIEGFRFNVPELIDEVICAELPDPIWDITGELTEVVVSTMTHGPCGDDYLRAPCMARKSLLAPLRCTKKFPKSFTATTIVNDEGYPEYRRRNDGRTFTVPKPDLRTANVVRDNRWVVPYNPYLLQKYRCHINVEVCSTVQAVKYIHKYIYKGSDRTTLAVESNDEIDQYIQGRYIGPTEAIWRLYEYPTHQEWPPVTHLTVHLEHQQTVYFTDGFSSAELAEKLDNTDSTLMGFFRYNATHEDGRAFLYSEFPSHYVWHSRIRQWKPRIRGKDRNIGRMYHSSPTAGERFYLRMLLTVVRGPTSFTDLRTYDGICHETYHQACIARGLVENDQEWIDCFNEAVVFTSGHGLRTLFLTGLRTEMIAEPLMIWTQFKDHLCDDLLRELLRRNINISSLHDPHIDYGLYLLSVGLTDLSKSLTDFNLPLYQYEWSVKLPYTSRGFDPIIETALADDLVGKLNADQLQCFRTICAAIETDPQSAHFYL